MSGIGGMIWRALTRMARRRETKVARAIWDEFGGECGNDSDYCRWTGKRETIGKCYCQETAWRHTAIAFGRKP